MKEKKIQVYLSWLQDNYSRGKPPPPPNRNPNPNSDPNPNPKRGQFSVGAIVRAPLVLNYIKKVRKE